MDAADFDRHLRLQLCWLDGFPTSSSHAGQRQCPHCRRKWSYADLRRQWLIAQEFCKGSSRRMAAKVADTDAHTAGRQYKRFQALLASYFTEKICDPEDGFFADPARLADACRMAKKTTGEQRLLRLLVDLCLGEMKTESRFELLYRLAFREGIQELIRSAMAARLLYQVGKKCNRIKDP